MRQLTTRRGGVLCAVLALGMLLGWSPAAEARSVERHKHPRLHAVQHMLADVMLPDAGMIADDAPATDGPKYELHLARQSGEILNVIYRVGDKYIPEAINSLSQFLRDNHDDEVKNYDPRTFDLLHTMLRKVDKPESVIQVLCGYRTQETNDELRASHTTNAAEHSQHIEGNAVDIRVPGVAPAQLRDAAKELGAGGVGYYPKGQFIHVDMGPVREWSYSGRVSRVSSRVSSSGGGGRHGGRHRRRS